MNEPVLLKREGAVATITLNRPDAGNAIDFAFTDALAQVLDEIVDDPAVRCVVITGAGRLFCAGGDIGAFAAAGDKSGPMLGELAGALHASVSRLARMAKPLVVLVNGPAAGAGMSLALLGDIVLAARSAHFTAAYGMVGLTPDGGMSWLLPRIVGLRRAQEMILTNRRVTAGEAAEIGLVTRVVDDADLAAAGQDVAAQLAQGATAALAGARALLAAGYANSLDAQLGLEAGTIAAAGATSDSAEGIAAFLARRRPQFGGVR